VGLSSNPQPDVTASERAKIEREAERFAWELREGNQPEIDIYLCRVAPSLRERLREELVGEEFSCRYGDATKDGKLRYWPVSQLGKGGFARVYAAWDGELGRFVAIKVLASTERLAKQRFLDEARRQAALKHPNLVQVHDAGVLPKGHPYAVMDYIEGGTLRQKLESEGAFHPKRAARILRQIALGVAAAHERNDGSRSVSPLVHQDLKPENILLDLRNQPYVADFGLAAAVSDLHNGLAGIGGTMRYMSPEQLKAFSSGTESPVIDTPSDVWALGVMFFEAMTGKHPFVDSNQADTETAESILNTITTSDVPGQLAQYRPARVPTELASLIADCLQISTEKRLVSAKDVAVRLEDWLDAADKVVQLQLPFLSAALSNIYLGASAERHRPRTGAGLGHAPGMRLSRFVWVPPGNGFSRNLISSYEVREGFWIGATPVTNAEYDIFLANTGYRGESEANKAYRSFRGKFALPTHPAVGVSWINAMRFCQWLSSELSSCGIAMTAILPSEAEWEYACRAGSRTVYCFGDSHDDLQDYAWIADNSGPITWDALVSWKKRKDWRSYLREVRRRECSTHAVGSKLPNDWGIYDMHGHVWEWCLDAFDRRRRDRMNVTSSRLSPQELESAIATRGDRVNRGGAWNRDSLRCASSFRNGRNCYECFDGLGFRVLLRATSQ